MNSPNTDMVTEVQSQLCSIMDTPIGTPAMEEIDRELAPILRYLMLMGTNCDFTIIPTATRKELRNLVDWFQHPYRTAEEFNYVVGPLRHDVFMKVHMSFYDSSAYPAVLCLAAAEALAVKCPVLEGSWEYAAWMVVFIVESHELSGIVSNWIIKVIGNADICPNAHLRLELMSLLSKAKIDIHNQTQAVDAVMSVCSALNNDYLIEGWYGDFSILTFGRLTQVFERIMGIDCLSDDVIGNGCLLEFGVKLANQLEYVNNMCLSRPLYHVSCQYGLNPHKYTEPRELHSLIALLEAINGCVKQKLKDIEECNFVSPGRSDTDFAFNIFNILIKNFKACFQIPQLADPTAKLVMHSIELLQTKIDDDEDGEMKYTNELDCMIKFLFINKGSYSIDNSPIGREIVSCYHRKLGITWESVALFIGSYNLHTLLYLLCHPKYKIIN